MAGYLVLARKYRPTTFADVIGQGVVTGVLQGALRDGRIGQAYLFSGPRGTGKTTTARILARCLNCVQGPTPEPCGTCDHCNGIDAGNDADLIEIDAATHTGVDHIRELREQAAYAPMKARYKVYIVDEVHMLSKAAFNALLKTLEEPPAHVVFLFATTEPHKVLPTILSRCQVLKLTPLSEEAIVDRLRDVLKQEDVTPGPGLLEEIARTARGGMRDALSLTDKLLALAGSEPTLEDLRRLGGHAGTREIEALCARIDAGDKAGLIETLSTYEGLESELISALLIHLRGSLVAGFCGEDSPLLPANPDERAPLVARAQRLTGERVELWMQELLHARERMRAFPGQERLVLELTLLDLARPETTIPLAELEARLAKLEGLDGSATAPPARPTEPGAAPAPKTAAPKAPAPKAPAPKPQSPPPASPPNTPPPAPRGSAEPRPAETSMAPERLLAAVVSDLETSRGALAELVRLRGRLEVGGDRATLAFRKLEASERSMAADRRNQAALRRSLEQQAGRPLELTIDVAGPTAPRDSDPPAPRKASGESRDPFTQEVADLFGGVIEDLG